MTHPATGNPIWEDKAQGGTPIRAQFLNAIETVLDSLSTGSSGTPATPEAYGAVGDGVHDDTAAINAALAAHGHVSLGNKTYGWSGLITVQAGHVLSGLGGSNQGVNPGASNLKALSAGAQIWTRGAGCSLRGLSIDANNLATNPVVTGGTGTGDAGTSPYFEDVTIMQAAAGGYAWKISASQNGTVTGCNLLNNAGEGLIMQDHAGGWLFNRLEITGSGVRNLHTIDSGNHVFQGCLIERCMHATNSPVYIEGIVWYPTIKFSHTTFASGGVAVGGSQRYLVEMVATGTLELESCQFGGITNEIAIRGGNGSTAPVIQITGSSYFTGAGLLAFLDYDSTTVVDLEGAPRGQVAGITTGTVPLRTVTSPDTNIGRFRLSGSTVYRTSSTANAESSIVVGDTQVRFQRLIDGTLKWGPGGSSATDVILARNGVGSLFLTGKFEASASMKAPSYYPTRQDFTLASNSSLAIDLSLGQKIFIHLNGFNLTGLSFTNATIAQDIHVIIKQGASPTTVTFPLLAGGVMWEGGDVGVPVIAPIALSWASFQFFVTDNGFIREVSRRGALRSKFDSWGWHPFDNGYVAANFDPGLITTAGMADTAGWLSLSQIKVPAGYPINYIDMVVVSAGGTLTAGTSCLAALYDDTGSRLGVTADQATAWQTTGLKHMALGSTVAAGSVDRVMYVGHISAGTTRPSWGIKSSQALVPANNNLANPGPQNGGVITGQSTTPTSITLANEVPYFTPWVGLTS